MEFWAELSQGNPSLSHLDSIGTEYEKCVKGAEHGFQTVLQLDRNSVATMRGYAQFLMDVSAGRGEGLHAQLSLSSTHTLSPSHTYCDLAHPRHYLPPSSSSVSDPPPSRYHFHGSA
jgi:hypothetical protein